MKLTFVNVENRQLYTKEYLKEREIVWLSKIAEYKEKNIPLWNGIVYYLIKIKNDTIFLGLCEYKDVIFLEQKGIHYIRNKFHMKFNFLYICVQVLLSDKRGNYLFGTKRMGDYKEIIAVGGTLRLEDRKKIRSLNDILEYAKKEIDTETKIKANLEKLKYLKLIINKNICTFLFEYNLDDININFLKKGEFDGAVVLSKGKIFISNGLKASERLTSIRGEF